MRFMDVFAKKTEVAETTAASEPELKITETVGKISVKNLITTVVAIIVALAMILTTILIGWYLFTDAGRNLIKDTMQTDKNTIQETTVDVQGNIIEYDVKDADSEATIVDDFNRNIEVIMMKTQFKRLCLATPLNATSTFDLNKYQTNEQVSQNWTEGPEVFYVPYFASIPDPSFLSTRAQTLCKGLPIHWALPKCGGLDSGPIRKRGLCSKLCHRVCKKYFGFRVCFNLCSWLC